jgi:hypothetical protein
MIKNDSDKFQLQPYDLRADSFPDIRPETDMFNFIPRVLSKLNRFGLKICSSLGVPPKVRNFFSHEENVKVELSLGFNTHHAMKACGGVPFLTSALHR